MSNDSQLFLVDIGEQPQPLRDRLGYQPVARGQDASCFLYGWYVLLILSKSNSVSRILAQSRRSGSACNCFLQ